MLELYKVEMSEMLNDEQVKEMIHEMLEDDQTYEMYCELIGIFTAVKVEWNSSNIGYFIYGNTKMTGRKEVHCFFYPSQRRYTFQVLRAIQDFFKDKGWGLYTTVTGPYFYIVKVLERIGFTVFHKDEDAVVKGGKTYPVFHMINIFKEVHNGL